MVGLAELRPEELAPEDVRTLPYVDLIAILRETNRCLGGHRTIREAARVLGFDVGVATLRDWLDLFVTDGWQVYELQTFPITRRADWVVEAYADSLVSQEHLSALPEPVRAAVRERW